MRKTKKKKRGKATLRGTWWKNYLKTIRHCCECGGKLETRYVKAEKCRRRVCVKCGAITYINPKVVAATIPILPNGHLVLLQRDIEPARGKWSYPAGYQELGETVEAAAVRETWEEIKVKVKIKRLLGIYSYPDAGVVTIVYEARVLKGQTPRPGTEAQDIVTVPIQKIPWKDLAFRSTTDALKDYIGS